MPTPVSCTYTHTDCERWYAVSAERTPASLLLYLFSFSFLNFISLLLEIQQFLSLARFSLLCLSDSLSYSGSNALLCCQENCTFLSLISKRINILLPGEQHSSLSLFLSLVSCTMALSLVHRLLNDLLLYSKLEARKLRLGQSERIAPTVSCMYDCHSFPLSPFLACSLLIPSIFSFTREIDTLYCFAPSVPISCVHLILCVCLHLRPLRCRSLSRTQWSM